MGGSGVAFSLSDKTTVVFLFDAAQRFVEEQEMAMLYCHQLEFAVGHGVGIHAESPEGITDRAVKLSTRVVPSYDVPMMTAPTPSSDMPASRSTSESVVTPPDATTGVDSPFAKARMLSKLGPAIMPSREMSV